MTTAKPSLKLYSIKEAALLLGRSIPGVEKLIEDGWLQASNTAPGGRNRKLKIRESAIEEFLDRTVVVQPVARKKRRTKRIIEEII